MASVKVENVSVAKTEEMDTSSQKEFKPALFDKFHDFIKTEEGKDMFSFVHHNIDQKKVIICVNDKYFQSHRRAENVPEKAQNDMCRRIFKYYGANDEECDDLNEEALSAALKKMTKWSPYGVLLHFLNNPKVEISHDKGAFKASLMVDGNSKFSGMGSSIHSAKNNLALNVFNDEETSIRQQYVNWLRARKKKEASFTFNRKSVEKTEVFGESEKKLHGFFKKSGGSIWKKGFHNHDDGTVEASFVIRRRGADKDEAAERALNSIKNICQPRKPKASPQKSKEVTTVIKAGSTALQTLNQHGQIEGIKPDIICQPVNPENRHMGFCATINYGGKFNMSGIGQSIKDAKQNAATMLLSLIQQASGASTKPKKKNNKRKSGGKGRGGKKPKQTEQTDTAAAMEVEE